jgi:hypothetical protein
MKNPFDETPLDPPDHSADLLAAVLRVLEGLPDRPPLELLERRLDDIQELIATAGPATPRQFRLRRALLRAKLIERLAALHVTGAAKLADAVLGPELTRRGTIMPGEPVALVDFPPAGDAVDGPALLAELVARFEHYVYLPSSHAATALALGILLAHTAEATTILPIIALTSPTLRCGKTTILTLASALCPRAMFASNFTTATIFRGVAKFTPTLILDEADKVFERDDEMRTLFNASHAKATARVYRLVGDEHEVRGFSSWCPKWIALISALPSTLSDRSITIQMQRRPRGMKRRAPAATTSHRR